MKCRRCNVPIKNQEYGEIWHARGVTKLCMECEKDWLKLKDDFLKTKVKREK